MSTTMRTKKAKLPDPKKAPTLDPAYFLLAASDLLDRKRGIDFACCALDSATGVIECGTLTSDHHTFFTKLLRPPGVHCNSYPWYSCDANGKSEWFMGAGNDPVLREARAMGLILCAILAAEGFEP
jgi:hypothetical protein